MALSSALNIAQSSLSSVTKRVGLVARNVSDAGNVDYARRVAVLESSAPGSRVARVQRSVDAELSRAARNAGSESFAQQKMAGRLDELHAAINGVDGSQSHSSLLTELHNRMQAWSAAPADTLAANSTLDGAKDLAASIRSASGTVQSFRGQADAEIGSEVNRLNELLTEFEKLNSQIVNGTFGERDVNDQLDQRDGLVKEIANIVPVSVINRAGHDMMLVTAGGATLFETVPRNVTFTPLAAYAPGMAGNIVRIDGVPVEPPIGSNATAGGSVAVLLRLRDEVSVKVQSQLDEVARGLITVFSERDPSSVLSDRTGLFTWTGAPAVPAVGLTTGLSSSITVNAAFDPAFGGSMTLLRDGGANGPAYVENLTGGASYADRLIDYARLLDEPQTFDGASGVGGTISLLDYSSQSIGWLDGYRTATTQTAATKEALSARLNEKLSNATGVNIDEEMSQLVALEHSYEASSRIIKAVDEMLASLLAAVR